MLLLWRMSPLLTRVTSNGRGASLSLRVQGDYQLLFRLREITEDLYQAKAFAHEPHVFAEPSESTEISSMRITPIAQTSVAFALVAREGGIDLVEAPIHHLGAFDYAAWLAATIEHDPAFAGRRSVRLVFRAAGRSLNPLDYEFEELIGKLQIVAESEASQVLIPFGDRLGHRLPGPV
jgi:hypothetical protein